MSQVGAPVKADQSEDTFSLTRAQLLMLFHASTKDGYGSRLVHAMFKVETTRVIKWLIRILNNYAEPSLCAGDESVWLEDDTDYMKEFTPVVKELVKEITEDMDRDGRTKFFMRDQRAVIPCILTGEFDKEIYMSWFGGQKHYPELLVFEVLNLLSSWFKPSMLEAVMNHRLIESMYKFWFEPEFHRYDMLSNSILVNLTREVEVCNYLKRQKPNIIKLLMDRLPYDVWQTHGISVPYLDSTAMVLCNLSRIDFFQKFLIDEEIGIPLFRVGCLMSCASDFSRYYLAGTIKNCLFNKEHHKVLVEEADILVTLLKPLAGGEQFPPEDIKRLPVELQYLPENKQREPCERVRVCLLESLLQLCQTREMRELLRENNIYVILREYHKFEGYDEATQILEDIINILIRTEEEIGVSDYNEIQDEELARTLKLHTIDSTEGSTGATTRP